MVLLEQVFPGTAGCANGLHIDHHQFIPHAIQDTRHRRYSVLVALAGTDLVAPSLVAVAGTELVALSSVVVVTGTDPPAPFSQRRRGRDTEFARALGLSSD